MSAVRSPIEVFHENKSLKCTNKGLSLAFILLKIFKECLKICLMDQIYQKVEAILLEAIFHHKLGQSSKLPRGQNLQKRVKFICKIRLLRNLH